MWKLAIVLCATAAFFASTKAEPDPPMLFLDNDYAGIEPITKAQLAPEDPSSIPVAGGLPVNPDTEYPMEELTDSIGPAPEDPSLIPVAGGLPVNPDTEYPREELTDSIGPAPEDPSLIPVAGGLPTILDTPYPTEEPTTKTKLAPETVSSSPTTESSQQSELEAVMDWTMAMVEKRHAQLYREMLERGLVDHNKLKKALASKYATKVRDHLKLIGSFIDDLISWGKKHGTFVEEVCRFPHESYAQRLKDHLINVTLSAPSQASQKVSLEFAEMVGAAEKVLRTDRQNLLNSTKSLQETNKFSDEYLTQFTNRAMEVLQEYENVINGSVSEEIVRTEWDLIIAAVPRVIEYTYECVTRTPF